MDVPPPMLAGEQNAPPPNFPIISPMHATPDHQPGLNSEKIKELEHGEDSIREARDQVLGARFRLKHHRRELRDLRQKTSIEEGSIASMIGNLLRDPDVKLAEEIRNAHARLLQLRDQLGSLEAEYEKAEERYEEMEWKYTQKESSFVAKLIDDANYPQEEDLTMTNVGSYVYVSGPTETGPQQLDYQDFQVAPVYVEPLNPSGDLSIPARDLVASPIQRSYSESAISEAHQMWADTRKRIEMWIFDSLSCSAHQKFMLRNMLTTDDLDDDAWWQLVMQTWNSDSTSTPPPGMHGACTASGESADAITTAVDERDVSDNADTERLEMETVRIHPTPGTLNEASTQAVSPSMVVFHLDSIPGSPQRDCHNVAPASDCSIQISEPKEPEREPEKDPEKEPKREQHMGLQRPKSLSLHKEKLGHEPDDNTLPRYALSESSLPRIFTKRPARAGDMESGIAHYDPWHRPSSTPRKQIWKGLNPRIADDSDLTAGFEHSETDPYYDGLSFDSDKH